MRDGREFGRSPRTMNHIKKTSFVASSWATAVCPRILRGDTSAFAVRANLQVSWCRGLLLVKSWISALNAEVNATFRFSSAYICTMPNVLGFTRRLGHKQRKVPDGSSRVRPHGGDLHRWTALDPEYKQYDLTMPPKQAGWRIYKQQMGQLDHGDALWEPTPIYSYKRIKLGDDCVNRASMFPPPSNSWMLVILYLVNVGCTVTFVRTLSRKLVQAPQSPRPRSWNPALGSRLNSPGNEGQP
ncbi:hypothetical protein BDM02DRAFT_1058226 [Thelephora ganbajun]|uniref:Uncharacterized protein n=1 Tax=Thelephora ganbajun TaxID=370292 RepID=A0ACB6Z3R2_THEGA|nr:hypothetical protein BDM02DRAFT_1058226 [Thelephora ganbajun]